MPDASVVTSALVVHPGALGDVLLAIPALRALRAGGFAIRLAAQPRIGALLVALGEVDEAIGFDTLGLEALFADAALAPDAPVVRHLTEVDRVICWFGARDADFARRVRALAPGAVIAPPAAASGTVWEHLCATVGTSTADAAVDCTPIAVSPALRADGRRVLRDAGWDGRSRVVVLHPGAGGVAKRWPVSGFAAIVEGLDATIVVHEGPADAGPARDLLERLRDRALALIDPPLAALAGVLAEALAYVGNDSGVSQLAAAVGAPSIVLFTPPMTRWVPWSPAARCLTVTTSAELPDERAAVRAALAELA